MIISSSAVSLAASQISASTSSTTERLRMWDKNSDTTVSSSTAGGTLVQISSAAKSLGGVTATALPVSNLGLTSRELADFEKQMRSDSIAGIKATIIKEILEALTGRTITIYDPTASGDPSQPAPSFSGSDPAAAQTQPQQLGWGIDYYAKSVQETKQGISFSATGAVTTADGRNVNFSLSLQMTRETYSESTISVKAGDALKDPLVIDLSGNGAGFSAVKFQFDLDNNGSAKSIYAPAQGCGFLAYDKNGNGIIDNGSELLGPQSGNGFSDLSALDQDHNGWIDENDSAFGKLKVWQKNADGSDSVMSLRDCGIGAIYAGGASTHFDLTANNAANGPNAGVLRETGMYLCEDGGAGVVQEVDMVV